MFIFKILWALDNLTLIILLIIWATQPGFNLDFNAWIVISFIATNISFVLSLLLLNENRILSALFGLMGFGWFIFAIYNAILIEPSINPLTGLDKGILITSAISIVFLYLANLFSNLLNKNQPQQFFVPSGR